jgi:hypothetical protein
MADSSVLPVVVHGEKQKILLKVRGVAKDPLALVTADDDMIECAVVLDAWLAWHELRIAKLERAVNNSCFKSDPIWSLEDNNHPDFRILRRS